MPFLRTNRRWFSYSIRTMLLLLTICCIFLALRVNHARRQRELLAAILHARGQVHYDFEYDSNGDHVRDPKPPGPEWLRNFLGLEYFADIEGALFWDANDDDIKQLCDKADLRSLNFLLQDHSRVTDRGLKYLGQLTSLEDLSVQFSNDLTDDGVVYLGTLKNLKYLALNFCGRLTDAGLKPVKKLAKLEFLMINGTQVTKAGVDDLQLALPHCRISFQK